MFVVGVWVIVCLFPSRYVVVGMEPHRYPDSLLHHPRGGESPATGDPAGGGWRTGHGTSEFRWELRASSFTYRAHYRMRGDQSRAPAASNPSTLPMRAGLDTSPPACRSSTHRPVIRLIFQLWKLVQLTIRSPRVHERIPDLERRAPACVDSRQRSWPCQTLAHEEATQVLAAWA